MTGYPSLVRINWPDFLRFEKDVKLPSPGACKWQVRLSLRPKLKNDDKLTRRQLYALRKSHQVIEAQLKARATALEQVNERLSAERARRQRSEQELNFLLEVTREIAAADGFFSSLDTALRKIGGFTGWEIGEAWLPCADGTVLEFGDAFYRKTDELAGFTEASRRYQFPCGSGLPGRVWRAKQPEWLADITLSDAPRAQLAREFGLKAAFAVPITSGETVLAVLAFFMREVHEKDEHLVSLVSAIGAQIGSLLQRKQVGDREVTERIKAEDWFRRLIATTQDAVVSIDRQGRVVLFNPAAERIFGYSRDEIVGQKVNILMGEPYASEHDEYVARYERTREAKAIGRIRTVTAKRKNGELFPIELSVTEIESDETVHYGAFIRDISEKTRLQAQLLETERLAAIGSTAAKIGHELANPLNGMSLTIQLLEQHLARLFKEPAAPVVTIVKRLKGEISRLNHLVGEFRTISRKEKYEFRPTELGKLIEDIAALQGPHLANHGIELERSVPANLPVIAVDSDKIKQALLNLIKNAAEAMPDGGKITLDVSATRDRLVVQVGDSGRGIDPDIDPFEPFVTTKRDGTGIGLVIVRQIVTAHGGTISYRSQPNVSTTFEIALPLK